MFNLWGLTIHLYGIFLGLGIWTGLELAILAKPKIKVEIESAFIWLVGFGLMGARLYHVVDFWQRYYQYNLVKIFYLWEGGLGIWGAIIGVVAGLLIYCRVKKVKILPMLDALSAGAPIAQAIGRLGNWVNGEIVGKNGEPLFAYEAILNTILFVILWRVSSTKKTSGKVFGSYLIGYGVIRILLEEFRPSEIIWRIGGIPTANIFGAISILAGIYFLFKKKQS